MSKERHSVLFVCTANRIRSVMAEAFFRRMVEDADAEDWRIESAGTWAAEGQPPMPNAVLAMVEHGIDVRDHRSRSVDHTPLDAFALILVMERGHKESLTWEFPNIADRVFLITELAGDGRDVADPVSGPLEDHTLTAGALQETLRAALPRIRELSREADTDDG